MRTNKKKILLGTAVAAAALAVTVGALHTPVAQYIDGRITAAKIAAATEALPEELRTVLEAPELGYVIGGSASEDGYTLDIQADGLYALTGRIALDFDTTKLALDGPDDVSAFHTTAGIKALAEAEDMVSSDKGYACLAWYYNSGGLDARRENKTIATLDFTFKDGYNARDIDASSFRLRAVEEGDMGPFLSAASFQGKGTLYPINYEYLTEQETCGVTFTYEGSDRAPSDGKNVTFSCANNLHEPVNGVLELGGSSYVVYDGGADVTLADGEYQYRVQADGYGPVAGRLTVSEDTNVELTFATEETLVAAAKQALEIGYTGTDTKDHVTSHLTLPITAGDGVDVAWASDSGSVDNAGFVVLPKETGVTVNLTATLTKGQASDTKNFTVYVCSEAELAPKTDVTEPTDETTPAEETKPTVPEVKPETKPAASVRFTDLQTYEEAREAILALADAGIINGTSATTFTPDANIKRGDFLLMLMRMLDVKDTAEAEAFADVPEGSYYYDAIMQARGLGITDGTGANRFTPNAAITRQEMITMTMRAMEITGYLPMAKTNGDLTAFTDKNLIADYAEESMQTAVGQELIRGNDGKLDPLGNTTRAQTAVFLQRIWNAHNS